MTERYVFIITVIALIAIVVLFGIITAGCSTQERVSNPLVVDDQMIITRGAAAAPRAVSYIILSPYHCTRYETIVDEEEEEVTIKWYQTHEGQEVYSSVVYDLLPDFEVIWEPTSSLYTVRSTAEDGGTNEHTSFVPNKFYGYVDPNPEEPVDSGPPVVEDPETPVIEDPETPEEPTIIPEPEIPVEKPVVEVPVGAELHPPVNKTTHHQHSGLKWHTHESGEKSHNPLTLYPPVAPPIEEDDTTDDTTNPPVTLPVQEDNTTPPPVNRQPPIVVNPPQRPVVRQPSGTLRIYRIDQTRNGVIINWYGKDNSGDKESTYEIECTLTGSDTSEQSKEVLLTATKRISYTGSSHPNPPYNEYSTSVHKNVLLVEGGRWTDGFELLQFYTMRVREITSTELPIKYGKEDSVTFRYGDHVHEDGKVVMFWWDRESRNKIVRWHHHGDESHSHTSHDNGANLDENGNVITD